MRNDSMPIFIKYNSKVCSVGRFDLLLAKGGRSPRVVWVYNFVPLHGAFGDQKMVFAINSDRRSILKKQIGPSASK